VLDLSFLAPSETFYRMLKFDEFDISEMSLSSYLIARAQGKEWTASPVFSFRGFFHINMYRNAEVSIEEPRDLEGKRVGLTEYQVTAAVWMRGALQHRFGLDLRKIKWFVERTPEMSHDGVTDFHPPKGISIERIPPEETLHSLLEAGELDAILPSPYPGMASQLNRTDELRFQRSPKIKRLFQDAKDEAISYFRQTSLLPINHTIIIKNSILEAHAGVAMSLYRAFQEAKALTYERLNYLRRSSLIFSGLSPEEERELFGDDPYPYGLEANRCVLETLIDYSHEQENSSRRTLFLLEPRTTVRNMRLLPRR
jgi:4,5-dihydroxyphthalate decarboxylase